MVVMDRNQFVTTPKKCVCSRTHSRLLQFGEEKSDMCLKGICIEVRFLREVHTSQNMSHILCYITWGRNTTLDFCHTRDLGSVLQ